MSQENGGVVSSGQTQADAAKASATLYTSIFTRILELVTFVLMAVWVFSYLGGLSFEPKISMKGNDTGGIFNWHPLLMTLAFPVLMTEALLAYRAPLASLDRPQQKLVHAAFHSAALLSVVFGVLVAWKSHTLKLPTPTPNLYSSHSYMGVLTVTLFLIQYTSGVLAFLLHVPAIKRAELLPYHRFMGAATYWTGLSTMLMGIQEKGTFLQLSKRVAGDVYSGILKTPAVLSLFIVFTGLVTLFQLWPVTGPASDPASLALLPNGVDEDDV